MSNGNSIVEQWAEICTFVEAMSIDMAKGVRGNDSAAARSRRNVRLLRKHTTALLKDMIAESKEIEASKAAKKATSS